MKIKIWGARGSVPSPLTPEAVREKIYQAIIGLGSTIDPTDLEAVRAYIDNLDPLQSGTAGGNTTCLEIQAGNETIIIDAGSGIRELGLALMAGPCGQGQGTIHLFFSHPHWDHIQGFPFFRPAFVPGNRIIIYHVHPYDWRNDILSEQQRRINFPVSFEMMQATFEFVPMSPDQTLSLGPLSIRTLKMHHPGDSYAFRFEDGYSTFVCANDAAYTELDEPGLRPYLEFFQDADVLIFDSQLTLKEATIDKEDWGHSSALIGDDLARRAGVKKLVLFHHDPSYSDSQLLAMRNQTLEYQAQDTFYAPCEVIVAYEGLTFDLVAPHAIRLHRLAKDDAAIVTLPQVFDERSVQEFEQQLTQLTETGWPARLIIDLSQVESLAMMGLKPLIALRRYHPDTLIALVGLSERVRRVIGLAGFLDFFAIYHSWEEVLTAPKIRETTGQLIKNRYQIGDKIGESWLGIVFRAQDTQIKAPVAIKVLSNSFSQQAIDQFLNQARQIIRLDHPNVVNMTDCDRDQGLAYIVQELMEGRTLQETLEAHPDQRLPLEQVLTIGLNITRALEYAHSRGVIHGDLRPKNIFLTKDVSRATPANSLGTVKLTDFGLGRLREGKNLLEELLVLPTAEYLAPEQILGQPLDARTDLYAMGVILYELVTGRPPFEGTDQAVMQAHLNKMPPSLRKFKPNISRSLEHFILKLLAKDPEDRYATAHQTQRVLSNLGALNEQGGVLGLTGPRLLPLVGREQPLQALLDGWNTARQGRGQLLLISGETGIGKTRLSQEVAELAQAGTLLVGNCHALEGSLAYQPFIEALRTYFATVPPSIADKEVGQLLSNVVHWVPEIRFILPDLPEAPPLDPRQEQLRLMNSLAQYIERATQEHPWLLILDDLHWADQSSLQLLHYLARHCTATSLLIIGTYRDTDLAPDHPLLETLHSLRQSSGHQLFPLERLNKAQVSQMLSNIWDQMIPESLVEKIYQVTEGNPFYVEEVAKGLVDEGTVRRQEGSWHFSAKQQIRLPQSVRDAVLRRIAQLKPDTQNLLRQAAVLGRSFNFDDLQQLTSLPEWTVLEHLDVALERQLVEEAPGETTLRFRHAEIQQVLYQELSTLRRRLLHRQAGEALELRYLTDPRRMAEELAHHFGEAGEAEKTLIYSIQAARHADQAYASQTALMWYERALSMLDQLGMVDSTQVQRFDLLLARERLFGRQGMREKQAADLAEAQSVAQKLKDPARQARVHNQQSYFYRLTNEFATARHHAEMALQAARQAHNTVLEGESLSNMAYIERDQSQYQTALEHMAAAQAILEQTEDRRGEAIALKGLGDLHRYLNNFAEVPTFYDRALAMNRALGNRRGEAGCLNNMGEFERERGHYSAALNHYEQTLGISQAIGDRQHEAIALHNLALTYLALGSYEAAQHTLGQALPIYRSIEYDLGLAEALTVQAEIHTNLNQFEAARDSVQQALALCSDLAGLATLAVVQFNLGLALEGLGDTTEAQPAFEQSLAYLLDIGDEANALDARAGLARCRLAQGDPEAALTLIEQSLTWLSIHSLSGLEHPFRFYLTAYQVLQAAGQTEAAQQVLAEAHTLLQERAANIADEALRHSFLENVPQNRAIVAAWTASQE
jgi:anti-anti-sigma factor